MSGRVIVVGSVNVDLVVRRPRLPAPGETVTGGTFERHHGGKGGNQAVAAARLGASVAIIGAVGADSFGDEARAALVEARRRYDQPGHRLAQRDRDRPDPRRPSRRERDLGRVRGESGVRARGARARARRPGSLAGDVVLVSNELAPATVGAALRAAPDAGARTIFNPAPADGIEVRVARVRGHPDPEPRRAGDPVRVRDAASGPDPKLSRCEPRRSLAVGEAVIVTLGADGALVVRATTARSGPCRPSPSRSSTRPAPGMRSTAPWRHHSPRGSPLKMAVRRAVAAGGLATTRVGAREGMPTAPSSRPRCAPERPTKDKRVPQRWARRPLMQAALAPVAPGDVDVAAPLFAAEERRADEEPRPEVQGEAERRDVDADRRRSSRGPGGSRPARRSGRSRRCRRRPGRGGPSAARPRRPGVISRVRIRSTPTTWTASATAAAMISRKTIARPPDRHAASLGDLGIDRREGQRPVDDGQGDQGQGADRPGAGRRRTGLTPVIVPNRIAIASVA